MKRILLLELCLLFLATTFQGDRMTGWVQQTIPRQDLAVKDLQFIDSLTGFMVSSRRNPDTSFVFKTTDGGNNWSTIVFDNLYLTCLNFPEQNIGYCAGGQITNGTVKKTTNGGQNWFTVSLVSSFIYLEDVFFINKDTGWVSSTDIIAGGLWRTTNGGLNWQLQLDYNFRPSKIFFVNSSTGWVIGNIYDLYKTTNCGVNWILQANLGNSHLTDIYFATADTGWMVKEAFSTPSLMRTINGGNNWDSVNAPTILMESRLYFVNNKKGWAGSAPYKIYVTSDGYNWGTQTSPRPSNYNVSFVDTLKGWASAFGLVHTTDGGGPVVNVNQTSTEVPKDFVLEQNYPNPFNALSKIKYQILKSSEIRIAVYDITGKEVDVLLNGKKNPGEYDVTFNANILPSGIYFYALFADGKRIDTKKAILIK